MRINNDAISVAITIAGGDIAITESNRITIGPRTNNKSQARYDLGPATKSQFKAIISYFERLSIHAIDN